MRLSFLPGQLELNQQADGTFLVTVRGEAVVQTKNEKQALAKFNGIRKEMEAQFPPHELTIEEKTQLLLNYISTDKSTFKGLPRRKYKSGSTNTFG